MKVLISYRTDQDFHSGFTLQDYPGTGFRIFGLHRGNEMRFFEIAKSTVSSELVISSCDHGWISDQIRIDIGPMDLS